MARHVKLASLPWLSSPMGIRRRDVQAPCSLSRPARHILIVLSQDPKSKIWLLWGGRGTQGSVQQPQVCWAAQHNHHPPRRGPSVFEARLFHCWSHSVRTPLDFKSTPRTAGTLIPGSNAGAEKWGTSLDSVTNAGRVCRKPRQTLIPGSSTRRLRDSCGCSGNI